MPDISTPGDPNTGFRLQQVDVQTSTIHTAAGYDAETGVGPPARHAPLAGTR